MSEFTECLKESLAALYTQTGTAATIGSTSVTGILSVVSRKENVELGGFDLDLNSTFTIDLTAISSTPTIGSILVANSVSYRVASLDTSIGSYVLGLREV
jgi:vacuolar-type H+-ATPase catalytic subunit A/Vma1